MHGTSLDRDQPKAIDKVQATLYHGHSAPNYKLDATVGT